MLIELEEPVPSFGVIYRDSMKRERNETQLTGYGSAARLKVVRRWHRLEEGTAAHADDAGVS